MTYRMWLMRMINQWERRKQDAIEGECLMDALRFDYQMEVLQLIYEHLSQDPIFDKEKPFEVRELEAK